MIDLSTIAANLEPTPEQIWRSKSSSSVSYPDWGNDACFQVEDVSFWFRHRNACILEAMKQYPPSGPVFDIGGGNGFVAKALQDAGMEVVLVEPGAAGSINARRRGIHHVVCARLEDAQFIPASMAAAGLFDVIEHISDDRQFLATIATYLHPKGRIYITVPAYQALWSDEDAAAGHFRRYTRRSLGNVLRKAGFRTEFLTGFFEFLPPVIIAGRVLPYRLGIAKWAGHAVNGKLRAQHEVRSALVRQPLAWLQERELARIRAGRAARFGGSWLAVAERI